jgi:hypothetical protein
MPICTLPALSTPTKMNLTKLQKSIEAIGENLLPDDDWMPALILEGKGAASLFGFVGNSMGNDLMKDIVADQITKCIAEFKPDCACLITTAWSIDFGDEPASEAMTELLRRGEIRPSQHPDRIEIVNAYCYGEKGESEGETLMIGYIQRFKDKSPRIKKWKIIEDDASAEGRFPDAIKEGFKLARGGDK